MAQSLKQQFVEWVGRHDREATYCYEDNGGCAFALFLTDKGMARQPNIGSHKWIDLEARDGWHDLPYGLPRALSEMPHTFGALTDRLAAQAA